MILLSLLLVLDNPEEKAAAFMLWGLLFLWVVVCGKVMIASKDSIRRYVLNIKLGWQKKFIIFGTILALLEESIALFLNSLAPILGAPEGIYLTATNNYLELVTSHSVVVFVPMFMVWAWLLKRYDFKPLEVMLLFGLSGVISEAFLSVTAFWGTGFWVLVYGLMVYLPAYSTPGNRPIIQPRLLHYVTAIFLPILAAIPVAFVIGLIK